MDPERITQLIGMEINEMERRVDKTNLLLQMVEDPVERFKIKFRVFQEIRDMLIMKGVIE